MWREAVRTSPLAIGLVQLSTTRFVEISDKAAELFGTTPEGGVGLDYLPVSERPQEAAQTFRLVGERMLTGSGADAASGDRMAPASNCRSRVGPSVPVAVSTSGS